MFELESKKPDEITITTKNTTVKVNTSEHTIDANLPVGKIEGPGEFEIGDASIRGIATASKKTIYDVEIGGIHIGILGDVEEIIAAEQSRVHHVLKVPFVKSSQSLSSLWVMLTAWFLS